MLSGRVFPTSGLLPLYFCLLGTLGCWGALALYYFMHPEELFFYANRGYSKLFLCGASSLLNLSLAVCALFLIYPHQLDYIQSWLHYLFLQTVSLVAQPLLFWSLGFLGLVVCVLMGISVLSAPLEKPEEANEKQSLKLQVDSVYHHFGRRTVLKGAWLKVQTGEILGLLGRNGCGKSTLLKIILGVCKPDSGVILVNEHFLKSLYLKKDCIAYLPQSSFLPRQMKLKRVVQLFLEDSQRAFIEQEPRLLKLLAQRVSELSGGERRFFELCLILALQRPFVLLDEPFSELEPLYKKRAQELIQSASEYSGIILTDHDYRQILTISERLMLMRAGETQWIKSEEDLKRFYLPD